MSRGREMLMPKLHHLTQAEVIGYLGRQLFNDAVAHAWLAPTVRRAGRTGTVFYAVRDVELVSRRVAEGEYPGQAQALAVA